MKNSHKRKIGIVAFGSTALLSTSFVISCSSSDYDHKDVIPTSEYKKLSAASLDAMAATIPGENDVPWRRGVAYEAGSQAAALLRSIAYELGWTEFNFAKSAPTRRILITDQDLLLAPEQILSHTGVEDTAANRILVNDFKKFVPRTNLDEDDKLNSYFGMGDDTLKGDVDPYEEALIESDGFPWESDLYARGLVPNSPETLNNPLKVYFSSWPTSDATGDMMVQISHKNVTRLMRVVGGGMRYPVIESELFKSTYLPILSETIKKFIGFDLETPLRQFGTIFPREHADFMLFIKKSNPSTEVLENILKKLNNGSHHLLALIGLYRGFDSSFVNDTNPLAVLNKYQAISGSTSSWVSGHSILGFQEPKSTFFTLLNFGRFNQAGSEEYGTIFGWSSLSSLERLSYFTNTAKLSEQLLKNSVLPSEFRKSLFNIKVSATSTINNITWEGATFDIPAGITNLRFSTKTDWSDGRSITSITSIDPMPNNRFLGVEFSSKRVEFAFDLTASSGVKNLK